MRTNAAAKAALLDVSHAAYDTLIEQAGAEALISRRGVLKVYRDARSFAGAEFEIDVMRECGRQFSLVTEDEIRGIGGENIVGAYAAMKYFQSLPNENNTSFVKAFKEMWGEDIVIGDVTQAAYLGPWLWKAAVEKAGSFDIDKIRAASPGIELKTAPEGYVRIHKNHHLWSKTRVGLAQTDGQYKVVYETKELMEPDPFPKGYQ